MRLAIDGGPKAKTSPYGKSPRFAGNELPYLQQALEQNTLFYGHGTWVKRACDLMREYTSCPFVVPCSSGSAAIHLGLIAAGIGPGDEVITTPNTDSGSVLGAIEEGAVPIFCDCGEHLQPTAESVVRCITPRTRAVVVVHLAGCPAAVDEIVDVCAPRGIAVIEDVAQAWGTKLHGQRVGTFSTAGCFSINDFKHISAGDGGFVCLHDEELYRRVHNYADKHYDRFYGGELHQAHHGMNYRQTELQGAVAVAQLERVDTITAHYHDLGEYLRSQVEDIPGIRMLGPIADGYATYWWTAFFIAPNAFTQSRDRIVEAIQAEGIAAGTYGKYDLIQKPLFQQRVARPWLADERQHYPFDQPDGRSYTYSLEQVPVHASLLQAGVMLTVQPAFTMCDMDETALGISKVLEAYRA